MMAFGSTWVLLQPFLRLRPFWLMPERRIPNIFSIPPHRAFADSLVDGLIKQFSNDRMRLAQGIILVPNNRAATAIQDAFVRQCEGGLLLPRMVPIGDPDLGENVGSALDPINTEPIPPAVNPLHRQLILARKLQQIMPVEKMGRLDGAQAMRLATELGRVIDQLVVERKTPADLRNIDVGELSEFWTESLKLLNVILNDWPRELKRLGCIDMADRRNQQLARVAQRWRDTAPPGFVIAAGISTAAPAIADLVKVVARLERGQLVLAGLDFEMPDTEWDALVGDATNPPIESHPQYHLRLLLDRVGISRGEVALWDGGKDDKDRAVRGLAVSKAMAPAAFTQQWAALKADQRKLKNLHAIEVATPAEEAQAIALALREAIETPGKTAALVTPDRELAHRVSAHLKRWNVDADDSAGRPLSASLSGTLLLALASAVAEHFAPVALLTLLKHPLVNGDADRMAWLDGVRKLDLALRGPRPEPHLAGIDALLANADERTIKVRASAAEWWPVAKALLEPLESACRERPKLLGLIAALRDTATALAGESVWAGQEGRAAADLVSNLEAAAQEGPEDVSPDALPRLLGDLMDGVAIRPARGGHPRLFIWGLLEAKLQSADVMILGGLNETVWPQLPSPDPWLAPAVRRQLELPSLERRIGLSAHDLASAMGAKEVLLTRAKRDGRSPTIASRFWLRLETLANGFELPPMRYDLLARQLDFAQGERAVRPKPCPPSADRPRAISVTEVDGLKADPYTFYAKKMLKLSALDAPGEEPDARWRGTFLHAVLEDWGKKDAFAQGALVPRLQRAFDTSGLHPVVSAMWQPRFEEAAAWFEAQVADGRLEGREPLRTEVDGKIEVAGVTLKGKADRIDILPDGRLAIIDYKTGEPASDLQVKNGFALQLGLLGLLADYGAFKDVKGKPAAFEYWSQARDGSRGYGKIKSPTAGRGPNKSDPETFVGDMFLQFEQAVEKWLTGNAPFTAKLHPDLAYSEFDQLMRYDEWQGRDG
jgi:ATP-dependent helicase/nuclease subunit B